MSTQHRAAARSPSATLAVLLEAGSVLAQTLDPQDVYHRLAEIVGRLMDCDSLVVSSYSDEDGLIRCTFALVDGDVLDPDGLPPIPLEPEGKGTQSLVIRSGEPLAIGDFRAQVATSHTAYYVDSGGGLHDEVEEDAAVIRAALIVPIKLEGHTIGAIQVMSSRADAYDDDDLQLLLGLASQLAVASANAHLFQEVRRQLSERQRIEGELRQSQKLESLGRLAGGVAHDFNNLLTVILGNASLLDSLAGNETEVRALAADIEAAARSASALTGQLLAFSRRQTLAPKLVDLNEIVTETAHMLDRLLGRQIAVLVEEAPEPVLVHADPTQLEQVVLNLAINARDAMPEGGRLELRIDPAPGSWARLDVADTGIGMDEETLAQAFEPFFTTKEPGKGTGLGLSTVYGIVEQSGGHVRVDSTPGEGTTFSVHLPRAS